MNEIWFAFWFFLPAGVANMVPVFVSKLPGLRKWNTPLDFGKTWQGKRIFGDNKTWRGLVTGTLMAGLSGVIIYPLLDRSIDSTIPFLLFAFIGLGALLGDAFESFMKRQRDIPSGDSWFPFDQTDYIVGGLIFAFAIIPLHIRLKEVVIIFLLYFSLHLVAGYVAYRVGLKDKPI